MPHHQFGCQGSATWSAGVQMDRFWYGSDVTLNYSEPPNGSNENASDVWTSANLSSLPLN